MTYVIDVLRQEHRNIEKKMLRVLERELSVFDRGAQPNYEAIRGVIEYFKDYPDSCHHPKEDVIFEKLKSHSPAAAAKIGDLHHSIRRKRTGFDGSLRQSTKYLVTKTLFAEMWLKSFASLLTTSDSIWRRKSVSFFRSR